MSDTHDGPQTAQQALDAAHAYNAQSSQGRLSTAPLELAAEAERLRARVAELEAEHKGVYADAASVRMRLLGADDEIRHLKEQLIEAQAHCVFIEEWRKEKAKTEQERAMYLRQLQEANKAVHRWFADTLPDLTYASIPGAVTLLREHVEAERERLAGAALAAEAEAAGAYLAVKKSWDNTLHELRALKAALDAAQEGTGHE